MSLNGMDSSGLEYIYGGKAWPARKADSLAAIYEPVVYLGSSTSHNLMGLPGLLQR
jgi:hypothetical protein